MNRYFINRSARLTEWAPRPSTEPRELHKTLPGYQSTPLHRVVPLASELGIAELYLKDESNRLTLPAFKILGASWAVCSLLLERENLQASDCRKFDDLRHLAEKAGRLKLVTASDGNHGRAVARIAAWLGWDAKVFMPRGTAPARIEAIRAEKAEVDVIDGTYDDAVARAAAETDSRTILLQDTSWEGYEKIPAWIVEGYSTMLWEIEEEIEQANLPPPDVVLVPVGVGAFAGAVIRHFRREGIGHPPRIIGIEPLGAECAFESLVFDEIVTVPGGSDTIMAGLNCGTLASIVWPYVRDGMDAVIALEDEWTRQAMRSLGSLGIIAGESGAAATGALLALCKSPELVPLKQILRIGPETRVLAFLTEGITDPDMYAKIVKLG